MTARRDPSELASQAGARAGQGVARSPASGESGAGAAGRYPSGLASQSRSRSGQGMASTSSGLGREPSAYRASHTSARRTTEARAPGRGAGGGLAVLGAGGRAVGISVLAHVGEADGGGERLGAEGGEEGQPGRVADRH